MHNLSRVFRVAEYRLRIIIIITIIIIYSECENFIFFLLTFNESRLEIRIKDNNEPFYMPLPSLAGHRVTSSGHQWRIPRCFLLG